VSVERREEVFKEDHLVVLEGLGQDLDTSGLLQLHDAFEDAADCAEGPKRVHPDLAVVDADLDLVAFLENVLFLLHH
jgi:hypothetical protein